MFDVGISEIMVIAVVALIVLGPEKLPKTARTLGHLFGRLQRYVSDVKADINRELALEELKKMQAEVKTAATDFQSSVSVDGEGSRGERPRRRGEPQCRSGRRASRRRRRMRRRRAGRRSQRPLAAAAPERRGRRSLPGFDRG